MTQRIRIATIIVGLTFLSGCDQWMGRTGWKPMTVEVPCGQRLENATWKGKEGLELWTMTRPLRPGETPETRLFKASTLFGVLEGQVTFIESFCKSATR